MKTFTITTAEQSWIVQALECWLDELRIEEQQMLSNGFVIPKSIPERIAAVKALRRQIETGKPARCGEPFPTDGKRPPVLGPRPFPLGVAILPMNAGVPA